MEPTPPAGIGATLDPRGRPYDGMVGEGRSDTRFLTMLHVAGGTLRVMDGQAIEVRPTAKEATNVDLGGIEDVRVSVIWWRAAAGRAEDVEGLRIDVNSNPAQRWQRFEHADGTDGGVGGVTSQAVLGRTSTLGPQDELISEADRRETVIVGDHDGLAGPDTVVFFNGFGDGLFPMSRGLDAAGSLASLVIWDARNHWRIAVPDGIPPADVTERETQLQDCIDGRRPIDQHGTAPTRTLVEKFAAGCTRFGRLRARVAGCIGASGRPPFFRRFGRPTGWVGTTGRSPYWPR